MRQGRLAAGQTVLIHGAAGGVGSIAVQLAREAGACVIGTGRPVEDIVKLFEPNRQPPATSGQPPARQ